MIYGNTFHGTVAPAFKSQKGWEIWGKWLMGGQRHLLRHPWHPPDECRGGRDVPPSVASTVGDGKPERELPALPGEQNSHIFQQVGLEKTILTQFGRPAFFIVLSVANWLSEFNQRARHALVTTVKKSPTVKTRVSVQNSFQSVFHRRRISVFEPYSGDSEGEWWTINRWVSFDPKGVASWIIMGHDSPSPLSTFSLLPLLLLIFSSLMPLASAYFADWSSFAERDRQPTCVDIPSNMTLCQNIGETFFDIFRPF